MYCFVLNVLLSASFYIVLLRLLFNNEPTWIVGTKHQNRTTTNRTKREVLKSNMNRNVSSMCIVNINLLIFRHCCQLEKSKWKTQYHYFFDRPRITRSSVGWGCRIRWLHLSRGLRPSPPTNALDMSLNCIWWCGSSPGTLVNIECPFITITPRSTRNRSDSTI